MFRFQVSGFQVLGFQVIGFEAHSPLLRLDPVSVLVSEGIPRPSLCQRGLRGGEDLIGRQRRAPAKEKRGNVISLWTGGR